MKGRFLLICSFLASFLLIFIVLPYSARNKARTDSVVAPSLNKDGYVLVINVELPHSTLNGGFCSKLKSHFGPHLELMEETMNISDISDTASVNGKIRELVAKYDKAKPSAIVFYNSLAMRVDTPLEECVMSTDRNRLSQVLTNFLSNAVKFTKEGSIVLGYKMDEGGSKIRFYCKDTGCGISEENLSSIFGKFVKINPNSQGSGIGLSLCEVIVHNLNGEIGVESKLGEGSTFWAEFKYKYSTKFIDVKMDENAQAAEEASLASSPVLKKVLIAEDNDSNFRLIKSVLGKRYDILHAWNGKEAVDMFTSEKPDLILMDIKMPVMDGNEATEAIRKISSDINIIAVTAYASAEDEKRIKSGGFNGFLSKPINFEVLRNTVFNALFKKAEE